MKIVKVQRSLVTTAANRRMLIYDQSQEVYYESDLTPEVDALLADRSKAYFFYSLDAENKIVLGKEAPVQSW